ncbi:MAG TPA: dienelactone hydrolase family protein [Candidatus Limnocylindria bacterium]|jgi:carboxymethylenebutenolidase|nr:dienelactone hydrolase family protein [Candidatus Limnocylindria bacterium]
MQQQIERAEFVDLGGGRRGYLAIPAGAGPFPGVLVYQEAYGVNEYVQSEVRRLAEQGYAAIAPDLFGGTTFSYDDFAAVKPVLESLRDDAMLADVRAATAFLDAHPKVRHERYGTVGFCMGGRLAVLTAIALGPKIAAAASFYGGNVAPDEQRFFVPLLDRLDETQGELLLICGADDESIAPREQARIVERLSAAKKKYTLSVYPGAGHAFASRDRPSYRPAQAEAAWTETLALFARTLT